MTTQKANYLNRIRKETQYIGLRSVANWFLKWGRVFGYFLVLVGGLMIWGIGVSINLGITGLSLFIYGIVHVYLCELIHYAAMALADMVDSITDLNCRYEAADQ